ncbi:MAG: FmdB family zinc ribbon protein [Bryobacteraceae bacterium]
MPVYEYRRRCCGRQFEIRATISEYSKGLKAVCPSCGSEDIERIISMAAILGGSAGHGEGGRGRSGQRGG